MTTLIRCALPALAAAAVLAAPEPAPAPRPAADPQPYHPNPGHLWNRVHSALHARVENETGPGADRVEFDPNELDPMLWVRFPAPRDYLLAGPSHRAAVAVLDEFLTSGGEKRIADPLRRAFLQRDLWALFDWLTDPTWARTGEKQYRAERRELYTRLARILPRLALTGAEIAGLPDNYAAAVAARAYPPRFDPARRDRPFLPADLWEPDGPWVALGGRTADPLASTHTRFFGGRSAFTAFLRLPDGRGQTLQYLKQLHEWVARGSKGDVPQFPPQTQLALARRMVLVDARGELALTRLTEAVQVRVVHEIEAVRGAQTFAEFKLRRLDLLAGKTGGLYAVPDEDCERDDLLFLGAGSLGDRVPVLASCRHCHGAAGILSVNSFAGRFDEDRQRVLYPTTPAKEEAAAVTWKRGRYSWGLLEGLTSPRPGR